MELSKESVEPFTEVVNAIGVTEAIAIGILVVTIIHSIQLTIGSIDHVNARRK